MSKLDKSLKDWLSRGFITSDQASKIAKYESEKGENSWLLSGLLILGACILCLGIVSIIAANWKAIPDFVKLFVDFAILGTLAFFSFRFYLEKKPLHFELNLLGLMLLCLASIGLISQIYNFGGEFYEALLFWSFITVGAFACTRNKFIALLWTSAFLVGLVYSLLESPSFLSLFYRSYSAVFMGVPLLCSLLTIFCKSLTEESVQTRSFRLYSLLGGIAGLICAEFNFNEKGYYFQNFNIMSFYPIYVLALLTALGIFLSNEYRKPQKFLLIMALALYVFVFHLPLLQVTSEFISALFTLLILSVLAVFMASLRKEKFFQYLLALVGLRFVILYFQAFGGLARTGLGLILSGALIIGLAILWNKYKKPLNRSLERWTA